MFWQFLVNAKTFYVSRIGHKRWCHTGYCYTHIPKQLSWLYGTIRHQEQGNPSDVKLGSIEKRKKIQTIKMTKFSNSIICSINEPNLWFLYALFKLSLYNCDGNKYYSILYYVYCITIWLLYYSDSHSLFFKVKTIKQGGL